MCENGQLTEGHNLSTHDLKIETNFNIFSLEIALILKCICFSVSLADKTRYNSSITFLCNPSIFPGTPELDSIDAKGCHLKYKWETMAACPNQSEIFDYTPSDCQVA